MKKLLSRSVVTVVSLALLVPALAVGSPNGHAAGDLTADQKILHVLNRLGYGARPGDIERVRTVGLQKYIERQLDPATIDDSRAEAKVRDLEVFGLSTAELFAKYPNPGALIRQLDGGRQARSAAANEAAKPADQSATQDENARREQQKERRQRLAQLYREYDLKPAARILPQIIANRVLRSVYSERQLQEVMVDFWQNHFNVFAGKAADRWFIPSYERDVLRPNALGNFKDLLVGTAQHPAMLFFLDNFQSVSPDAGQAGNGRLQQVIRNGGQLTPMMRERMRRRGLTDAEIDRRIERIRTDPQGGQQRQKRGINENYARELMELHTLGVDGGYTQKDIIEVAKCFTGWTIADPRGYRKAAARMITGVGDQRPQRMQRQAGLPEGSESGEFYFNPRWHDGGTKVVLGQKINEGGIKDGLKVLDILVNSPATARFIARKLCVKFVSDDPDPALVARVAEAFHRSGGDIKTTLRAIFFDKEFFAPENYRAKIKTPFELAISSIRALDAETNGGPGLAAMLNKLGEVPYGYQAPTGYPDKAEDWVNTGALLERLNFAIAVASNRIPGTFTDLSQFKAVDKAGVLDKAVGRLLGGEISAATRSALLKQIEKPLPEVKAGTDEEDQMDVPEMRPNGPGGRMRQTRLLQPSGDPELYKVVSLVLGSPEFQRQ